MPVVAAILALLAQTCALPPLLCHPGPRLASPPPLRAAGFLLCYAATLLFVAASSTLMTRWDGGALGATPALVTRGVYRVIRHPMCLAIGIADLGLLLGTGMARSRAQPQNPPHTLPQLQFPARPAAESDLTPPRSPSRRTNSSWCAWC